MDHKHMGHVMNEGNGETAIDPVCGMTVQKATGLHANVDGVEYYFCNKACMEEFLGKHGDGGSHGEHGSNGGHGSHGGHCCC